MRTGYVERSDTETDGVKWNAVRFEDGEYAGSVEHNSPEEASETILRWITQFDLLPRVEGF